MKIIGTRESSVPESTLLWTVDLRNDGQPKPTTLTVDQLTRVVNLQNYASLPDPLYSLVWMEYTSCDDLSPKNGKPDCPTLSSLKAGSQSGSKVVLSSVHLLEVSDEDGQRSPAESIRKHLLHPVPPTSQLKDRSRAVSEEKDKNRFRLKLTQKPPGTRDPSPGPLHTSFPHRPAPGRSNPPLGRSTFEKSDPSSLTYDHMAHRQIIPTKPILVPRIAPGLQDVKYSKINPPQYITMGGSEKIVQRRGAIGRIGGYKG